MRIGHIGLVIRNLLRDFLVFLIVIFVALFIWLKIGIKADLLVLGEYTIEKLYIKLDKKFTLKAQHITIPKSKAKPSFETLHNTFDRIKTLFRFFEYIELNHITFENNDLSVVFADDILYITSNDYEIAGNIHRKNKKFIADISMLYLKKKHINISGKLVYDTSTESLDAQGAFKAYTIEGKFQAKNEDKTLDFNITTDQFTDLSTLVNTFDLDKDVKAWIIDKIKARSYQLTKLEGKANVENDTFDIDYNSLNATLLLKHVNIDFKEPLEKVKAKELKVTFKDKTLYFDFVQPSYLDRSLEGSRGTIAGLLEKKSVLNLDLNITTPIDDAVKKILLAYKLDIPVFHNGKPASLGLSMQIPLGENQSDEKLTTKLKANLKKGILHYEDIKLPIKHAQILYDSTKKDGVRFEGELKKGAVQIAKTKIPVLGGKIAYGKERVTLKRVYIKEDWYEGSLSGNIDTKKKKATLNLDAKKILIGDKHKIFLLKNKRLPLFINYGKKIDISVPALAMRISQKKKNITITLKKLKKLKPFLRNIPLKIDDGTLKIEIDKNNKYRFKGIIKRNACFLYEKNNRCLSKIPIEGRVDKKNFHFYALNKRIHFNLKKSRIDIKNIHIDFEKLLQIKKKPKKNQSKTLVIIGKKSNIRYKKHTLVTDSYDLEIKPNGDIKAYGALDGDIVKLALKKDEYTLKALRIKDKMLHPLINFKGLKHGRYSVKLSGKPQKVMHGQIIIEGGVLSDFKAYNNTLAFINTLPALAALSDPGFSQQGFIIKEGVIDYRKIGDSIIFDSIYIKGSSATIAGKGKIDINKRTIQINLAIQTARELGRVVGSLPLVGYILMGKDKSMTVGLSISGTFDKPVIKTSAAQEILTLPFELLKRTLESPAHILNE